MQPILCNISWSHVISCKRYDIADDTIMEVWVARCIVAGSIFAVLAVIIGIVVWAALTSPLWRAMHNGKLTQISWKNEFYGSLQFAIFGTEVYWCCWTFLSQGLDLRFLIGKKYQLWMSLNQKLFSNVSWHRNHERTDTGDHCNWSYSKMKSTDIS